MNQVKQLKPLNDKQKQAVEQIDGPVLVIAGPGTGKTELLSRRVARILEETDSQPNNILCMTFTESGAANMRERLTSLIGPAGYEVKIGTYHAFGSDIIGRFSEYFIDQQLEQPIDTIGAHQIIQEIIDDLSYHDPMKSQRQKIKSVVSVISDLKRALLTPEDLLKIADENDTFINQANPQISQILAGIKSMPGKFVKALPYYQSIQEIIEPFAKREAYNKRYGSLADLLLSELMFVMEEAETANKSKPLNDWKTKWLVKDKNDQFIIKGWYANHRLRSLSHILQRYSDELSARHLYDYDDMILRSIEALENNDDLRFTLQEQYQYILLDEYQDTNAAQAKIIELLTNNPVSEGRPNVMAVGDDDQSIYAFQGAQYSNMFDFFKQYRDTKVVNLDINYRSHADIIETASNVAAQIDQRLFRMMDDVQKTLSAGNPDRTEVKIERRDFQSSAAEYSFLADEIKHLIDSSQSPSDIAILAPKHADLEEVIPYLKNRDLAIHYEKRENILDTPIIHQLLTMSRLAVSIASSAKLADSLWPEVLSYPYFEVAVDEIWQTSWRVNKLNYQTETATSWAEYLLENGSKAAKAAVRLILSVATSVNQDSAELTLDKLTGTESIPSSDQSETIVSPIYTWLQEKNELELYDATSQLMVLRETLRTHQARNTRQAKIADLLKLVNTYQEAGELILNTNPYNESTEAIQLMTTHKAKGLEFKHVFLVNLNNDTWGLSSSGGNNSISLPANLQPIRHNNDTDDERLRLLFVAMTRAEESLYLLNNVSNFSGKPTVRLKYLDERQADDGTYRAHTLPEKYQTVFNNDSDAPTLQTLELNWQRRHAPDYTVTLSSLLKERLDRFQMSPSHLNAFIDTEYNGPDKFFLNTILRFPSAPNISSQFGNSVHYTMNWLQDKINQTKQIVPTEDIVNHFEQELIKQGLPENDHREQLERGQQALRAYLAERDSSFKPGDKSEVNFKSDGILIDQARVTGIIDKLEIDEATKTITVVDYKTGKPSSTKNHKYTQQVYFYKLLVENSPAFRGYTVESGRLEYIEPDPESGLITVKHITFNDQELDRIKSLIAAVWQHIMQLDWPDIAIYPSSVTGMKRFEDYLIENYQQS